MGSGDDVRVEEKDAPKQIASFCAYSIRKLDEARISFPMFREHRRVLRTGDPVLFKGVAPGSPLSTGNSGGQRQFHLLWWQASGLISAEEGLATPGHPENQRVRDFAVMQVQKVWRAVVGFEHS
jgi:hypothetical protein